MQPELFQFVAHLIGSLFLGAGVFFVLTGIIGILRFPDFYTRLHAAGLTDTLGALGVLSGLMFFAGLSFVSVKLFLILLFLFFTSPTATHALANAAFVSGEIIISPVKQKKGKADQA